ncbi:MAG: carboxy-S-adenosyl-L-methionine synthase CmoA [Verrucomicrobiota bacterium JB023]|nr:carboxy-S-adenosyl-L-methionine synthase CmoA [Verrucomicrobiota bacterium JB023]
MKDEIYRSEAGGRFEFSPDVARVFEDMIRRSVPGYGLTLTAVQALAGMECEAGDEVYDLGCSLGACMQAAWQGVRGRRVTIHGIDSSPAMVDRAREMLAGKEGLHVHQGDAATWAMSSAKLILMNFTLQFVPVSQRVALLTRCHEALRPGGVLFLSEKFVSQSDPDEQWLRELHWQFKRQQGYSELEIARKREALEEVLVPESPETHLSRLREAGFVQVTQVLQCLNFGSWVARKAA